MALKSETQSKIASQNNQLIREQRSEHVCSGFEEEGKRAFAKVEY